MGNILWLIHKKCLLALGFTVPVVGFSEIEDESEVLLCEHSCDFSTALKTWSRCDISTLQVHLQYIFSSLTYIIFITLLHICFALLVMAFYCHKYDFALGQKLLLMLLRWCHPGSWGPANGLKFSQ